MFKPTNKDVDARVLDSINKPAWAFDATVHPVMVHALRVHAQRSSLRSNGHFTTKDKQEISDLFQQPQPTMSDDIAVALGVDKVILEHVPYSVAFGYLVRSIVVMILAAEKSALDEKISSFLHETLDRVEQKNGNLLTTVHPVKIGVLDEDQTSASRGRNEECVTLELLYNKQLCALLIPVQINGRRRITIEFDPDYKSKTKSSFLNVPEMTTTETVEENNPLIYMHQETILVDDGDNSSNSYAMNSMPTEYPDTYNHELHLDRPPQTNDNTQPDAIPRSYNPISPMSLPAPTQPQPSTMCPRTTYASNEADYSNTYNRELRLDGPPQNNYSMQPDMIPRSYDSVPPMSLPPSTQPYRPMTCPSATEAPNESNYSMQGFDAFNVNSVFENSRGRTFPVSRMYVATDSGTLSTPWSVRSNGNRLLSSAAARLAGTSAQIGSKPRWGQ
jgi:hypothetical protein